MKSKIKISSSRETEFYNKFQLGDETFEAVTEDLGIKKAKIVTRIYLGGEILYTKTADYDSSTEQSDNYRRLGAMMEEQHKSAVETFIVERSRPSKSKADHTEAIRIALREGNKKAAFGMAQEALANFPSDPVFLSYSGYLTAIVENKPREGARKCEEALTILRKSKSTDIVFFFPLLYLNLGRVYLKAKRRAPALNAFQEGLKYESANRELRSELKALGTRKGPVIPFLDRSNPINKYLGKLRHDLQNRR
jgi:tetratricopeptide (TPR) repeat protein